VQQWCMKDSSPAKYLPSHWGAPVQADGNFLLRAAKVVDGSNFCTSRIDPPSKKNFKFKCPFVPNTAFVAQVLCCFVILSVVDIFVDVCILVHQMRWRHLFAVRSILDGLLYYRLDGLLLSMCISRTS
jgi:hypothetical protein